MELNFESYREGFGSELTCPSCGSNYLNHEHIEIFDRTEDEEKGLHLKVSNGDLVTNTNLKGNPSPRRHGLTIRFICEQCEAKPLLRILQHKGNTYFDIT